MNKSERMALGPTQIGCDISGKSNHHIYCCVKSATTETRWKLPSNNEPNCVLQDGNWKLAGGIGRV